MTDTTPTESLILTAVEAGVATVRLNRPAARNALSLALMGELVTTLTRLDTDESIGAVVVTGDERAFAAGADIAEMVDADPIEIMQRPNLRRWETIRALRVPLVAAVAGVALGGGCELAMACDIVVAGESARFGQPEIALGIMPGGGGTQRLVRAVGKSLAMELILTGRPLTAREALLAGLVSRVVPDEHAVVAAQRIAAEIAAKPRLAARAAKDAILKAFDAPLEAGLAYERRSFELLFATDERRAQMAAFLDKRQPASGGRP